MFTVINAYGHIFQAQSFEAEAFDDGVVEWRLNGELTGITQDVGPFQVETTPPHV